MKHRSSAIDALPASVSTNGRNRSRSRRTLAVMQAVSLCVRSEAADVKRTRTRAAAGLGDTLAAIGCRAAVVAMVTGFVTQIAGLRRRARSGAIADDLDLLA